MSVILAGTSFAVKGQEAAHNYTINLTDTQDNYQLNSRTYIVADPQRNMTIQDITSAYNAGELKYRNTNPDNLLLDYEEHAFWLVFSVENETRSPDWFIDIGGLANGRSGITDKFLVYEMTQRQIFYDGFQVGSKNNPVIRNFRYIPVSVPSMQKAVFIMYVEPTIFKRISLNLSFKKNSIDTSSTIASIYISYIPVFAIASLLVIIIGFVVTKNAGFIPLGCFYIFMTAWYACIELPFYSNFPGIGWLSTFYPVINCFLICLGALLTIPARYNTSPLRIFLMGFLGFTIGITAFTSIVFPINTELQSYFTNGFSIFCLLCALLYLGVNETYFIKPPALCLAGWILFYLVGQMVKLAAFMGYIPISFFSVHAGYAMFFPMTVIAVIGVIVSIRSEQERKMNLFMRQAEKANTLLQAKKTKEENDHSRLLRVIEREREVMEELRNRESERTEEMRRAKIVADEANHAKSAFLAVVSHEIRTPMTGIMGMIRMLQDTDLSADQKDYLMTIKDSGDAMLALLNDILDFSKIEGGGMTLENIRFDLRRVLNGVQMLMKGHADQKGIAIRLNIHENVPETVYGDPTRLRQVILNLVGNALKFTSKGHVGINVFLDPAHEANKDDSHRCAIYFSVEDTGIGISEEAQEDLFTPFSQADSSISRKYGGTGLGLSICRRLVEAMEGEINLKSREGSGSTFFFTLPFDTDSEATLSSADETQALSNDETVEETVEQSSAHKPREYTQAYDSNRKRFLIVDDNEVNRKVVKAFLDKANYESVIIYSGREALKLLKSDKRFDAVFLDIEMPDMNGCEVAENILQDTSISHIPIIALTGNIAIEDLQQYKSIGFKGYVAKPVIPEELLEMIDHITSGKNEAHYFPADLPEPAKNIEKQKLSPQYQGTNKPAASDKKEAIADTSDDKTPRPILGKTLDEKLIQGLNDGLGKKQTIELLEDLFEKTEEIIGNLRKAIADDSMESVRMRAHELKGMAANFGLKAVSEKAGQLEKFSKNNEITFMDVETHIKDLLTLVERSQLALDDFFNE